MWIVRIALQRPYTFIVLAVLLLILGPLTILRTPKDIFPNIGIPVISVVWGYTGLAPDEMVQRITTNFERTATTTVNDIEHIESQTLSGVSVIKFFFHPNTVVDLALSQITGIAQTTLRQYPPGTQPPLILSYNASSVPVLQLAGSSATLPEQELYDLAQNFLRTQLATVQGASMPFPWGGKVRQINVDLDDRALRARGLSAQDVQGAIAAQNLILPSGTEKIGPYEYNVKLNASTQTAEQLNDLPIRMVNGAPVYIRDVAHVRDGFVPQTNIVRVNGTRAVLMTIQKTGSASTLDIIDRVKALLPKIKATLPPALDIKAIGDQSLFVRAAIGGVIREGVIAAVLTGLMILLFLGSWRSTLIITISIPLSVLASIIALSAVGETINIMTLGGLALAVGILVDDATVAIENINWHLEQGKAVEPAILDGARQIAVPALVSTLAICIVFVPMFFLSGVSRFLFVPLAEAVVFAMLASYILSRTLVPTLAKFWLHPHGVIEEGAGQELAGPLVRFQAFFEHQFTRLRLRYRALLVLALKQRGKFAFAFLGCVLVSFLLVPWLGEDFFPSVDSGQIKMHLRAPTGTRVEETARLCDEVIGALPRLIPAAETASVVDNIGLPQSGINLSYSNSAPIGPGDADILISLQPDHHPTADYVRRLRAELPRLYPGVGFAFLPADITSQILNFGLPAPVDIQIIGLAEQANRRYAEALLARIKHIPGIADPRIQQAYNYPELRVQVDRSRSMDLGLTQRDVATSMLISLSGSQQTQPAFWVNPTNGVSYPVVTQTPQYRMDSLESLMNLPVAQARTLGAMGRLERGFGQAVVSHYNTQPVIDIFAAVQDRDLGAVTADIDRILKATARDLSRGTTVAARGQIETMRASFTGLYEGLVFAILLVYLLIVVNFQSWTDPFIIITALPAALAGIVWMLFMTQTTLSVPALTGAIMCMGVATANSILIVSFARERLTHGDDPTTAAIEAGFSRFRPVLMTALAMIIGMLPMALGLGEGGEQNAPLGRAVIGGLLFATLATLYFVPAMFALIHGRRRRRLAF